jgi:hypothetical protein
LYRVIIESLNEAVGDEPRRKNAMPKNRSRKSENGMPVPKGAKARAGNGHENGYIHVISPATASEIKRAVGVKRSHITNILRAFSEAGIKV